MKSRIDLFFKIFFLSLLLGLGHTSRAQTTPNPNAAPNDFVQQVADQVLAALKADSSVRAGNTARVIKSLTSSFCLTSILKKQRASQQVAIGDRRHPNNKQPWSKRFAAPWVALTAVPSPASTRAPALKSCLFEAKPMPPTSSSDLR